MSKAIKYSREFKLDALNLLQEGKSISEISRSLGISVDTLCTWRRRYKLYGDKAFQGPGIRLPKNEQQEELRRLKKENAELKMERDILKKALSIFSKKDQ
jgi:transposase